MRRPKFETVSFQGAQYHVGCGGQVVEGVCIKCGGRESKGNIFSRLFSGPFITESNPEEDKRTAYRMRLRRGLDIRTK